MSSLRFEAFLARLYSDRDFLEQFLSDPGTAMSALDLDARERNAAAAIDRVGLLMAARSYEIKRARRRASRSVFTALSGWLARTLNRISVRITKVH